MAAGSQSYALAQVLLARVGVWVSSQVGMFLWSSPLHTQSSVESTHQSAVLHICSTVVENQPWSPKPTYFELWAKKTAKKAVFSLYQVLLLTGISYIIHSSAIFSLAHCLPKVSTWGKGRAQSRYIPALRAIFLIITVTMNLYVLSSEKGMFQCPIFNSPWLERGLQHNTFLLANNHILV